MKKILLLVGIVSLRVAAHAQSVLPLTLLKSLCGKDSLTCIQTMKGTGLSVLEHNVYQEFDSMGHNQQPVYRYRVMLVFSHPVLENRKETLTWNEGNISYGFFSLGDAEQMIRQLQAEGFLDITSEDDRFEAQQSGDPKAKAYHAKKGSYDIMVVEAEDQAHILLIWK